MNKVSLTANGNQYKKTNTGKIVGLGTGAATFSSIGLAAARNKITTGATGLKGNADFFLIAGLITAISFLTGAVIDRCINHDRRTQADGEAKLKTNA